jgi:hypothetical protein
MLVWEEMKDTGELCTSDTDSEAEYKPTGEELRQTLDKVSTTTHAAEALRADLEGADWPQRVLRLTIFVSSIAAEILRDTNRTDWDEICYEECQKLLVQETT